MKKITLEFSVYSVLFQDKNDKIMSKDCQDIDLGYPLMPPMHGAVIHWSGRRKLENFYVFVVV